MSSFALYRPSTRDLPEELVIACLCRRQRSFAVRVEGALSDSFLVPIDREDDPRSEIRRGHERAIRGHLRSMAVLWREDKAQAMAERYRELATIGDTSPIGSLLDRSDRTSLLAEALCHDAGLAAEANSAAEAARLLLADRGTHLVRDFPELKGRLAGLLARFEGYPESVWQAIYDQAAPVQPTDSIPRGRIGKIVALADRIHNLVVRCGFGQLMAPESATRDRALAQGAVRIVLQGKVAVDLDLAAARATRILGGVLSRSDEHILADLRPVFEDALRAVLAQDGYRPDEIEAVLSAGGSRHVAELKARVEVLNQLQGNSDFSRLVRSAKRLVEIIGDSEEENLDPERLSEDVEVRLYETWHRLKDEIDKSMRDGRAERWLDRMLELNSALEGFFAEVLIRDENDVLKRNRLAMMQEVHRVYSRSVRLAEIEGPA